MFATSISYETWVTTDHCSFCGRHSKNIIHMGHWHQESNAYENAGWLSFILGLIYHILMYAITVMVYTHLFKMYRNAGLQGTRMQIKFLYTSKIRALWRVNARFSLSRVVGLMIVSNIRLPTGTFRTLEKANQQNLSPSTYLVARIIIIFFNNLWFSKVWLSKLIVIKYRLPLHDVLTYDYLVQTMPSIPLRPTSTWTPTHNLQTVTSDLQI